MDQVEAQCDSARDFPKNLLLVPRIAKPSDYVLDLLLTRLNDQEGRLFCAESKASLDFFEFDHGGQGDFSCTGLGTATVLRFLAHPRSITWRLENIFAGCRLYEAIGPKMPISVSSVPRLRTNTDYID